MIDAKDLTEEQAAILFIISKLSERFTIDKLYIQKIVFLVTRLLPDTLAIYDYEPAQMGMYSAEVMLTVKREEDLGLIERLKLTPTGKDIVSQISKTESIRKIDGIFSSVEELGKSDILYLLYNLYPEFTINSQIKESVDSYKLQSATIDTKALREGAEKVIKTDKGNSIVVRKDGMVIRIIGYKEC